MLLINILVLSDCLTTCYVGNQVTAEKWFKQPKTFWELPLISGNPLRKQRINYRKRKLILKKPKPKLLLLEKKNKKPKLEQKLL